MSMNPVGQSEVDDLLKSKIVYFPLMWHFGI